MPLGMLLGMLLKMFDAGEKIVWRGDEYTILKTYEQTMVQIVDVNDNVRSAPLLSIIAETMNAVHNQTKENTSD
tara:strand:+ start:408 stop:629 length:222 start_codon:yes stop_codon:yes gene_type:complete